LIGVLVLISAGVTEAVSRSSAQKYIKPGLLTPEAEAEMAQNAAEAARKAREGPAIVHPGLLPPTEDKTPHFIMEGHENAPDPAASQQSHKTQASEPAASSDTVAQLNSMIENANLRLKEAEDDVNSFEDPNSDNPYVSFAEVSMEVPPKEDDPFVFAELVSDISLESHLAGEHSVVLGKEHSTDLYEGTRAKAPALEQSMYYQPMLMYPMPQDASFLETSSEAGAPPYPSWMTAPALHNNFQNYPTYASYSGYQPTPAKAYGGGLTSPLSGAGGYPFYSNYATPQGHFPTPPPPPRPQVPVPPYIPEIIEGSGMWGSSGAGGAPPA
jgi:hypothetical protein